MEIIKLVLFNAAAARQVTLVINPTGIFAAHGANRVIWEITTANIDLHQSLNLYRPQVKHRLVTLLG